MSEESQDRVVVAYDATARCWLEFHRPVETVWTDRPDEVLPFLRRVEKSVGERGLFAAGFLSYEAASAFDRALQVRHSEGFPLLWFRLFEACIASDLPASIPAEPPPDWSSSVSPSEYAAAIQTVKELIREGDTYQVNLSFRLRAHAPADPWGLFRRMISAQGNGYGVFLDTGRWVICSASPELFFRLDGDLLISKPMKGTAPRGFRLGDDLEQAEWLRTSEKNRAENLMIVDMVRNDMGRIAEAGSVSPAVLFEPEKYPTLWQMTSTIRCRSTASLADIFTALFPAASITGAPKVRTTEIIRKLETTPRRIYTGAAGFLKPDRVAQFNVAIRTVLIDTARQIAEYGTGSGVVWDSEIRSEYKECFLKAAILSHPQPEFELLETIRWTPKDGFFLLDRHMHRLGESSAYFDRDFDIERISSLLTGYAGRLPRRPHRVRLSVPVRGEPRIEASPLTGQSPDRIFLAMEPIDQQSVFLYHKTTNRTLYASALAQAPDCDDVLLWNREGEITESCIANVVVEKDGVLLTPPVHSGLLPGVYRSLLLDEGRIREAVVRKEDLPQCSRIFLINSVRMMWEITLQSQARERPRS